MVERKSEYRIVPNVQNARMKYVRFSSSLVRCTGSAMIFDQQAAADCSVHMGIQNKTPLQRMVENAVEFPLYS
jgi:hypothetical protein